jgi:hypothetical protein
LMTASVQPRLPLPTGSPRPPAAAARAGSLARVPWRS